MPNADHLQNITDPKITDREGKMKTKMPDETRVQDEDPDLDQKIVIPKGITKITNETKVLWRNDQESLEIADDLKIAAQEKMMKIVTVIAKGILHLIREVSSFSFLIWKKITILTSSDDRTTSCLHLYYKIFSI